MINPQVARSLAGAAPRSSWLGQPDAPEPLPALTGRVTGATGASARQASPTGWPTAWNGSPPNCRCSSGSASGSARSEVAGLAPAGTGITNIRVRFDEGFPRS